MTQPSSLQVRRENRLGSAYRLFYDEPLHLVKGEGVWLTDANGQRYLDAYNNVPHVGHCHPAVVEAISRQAATLNTHTRYLHEHLVEYAERITSLLPGGLDQVFFACSGTEANDLALRLARAHTGQHGVLVTEHAYHGHSTEVVQLSTEITPAERRGAHVGTFPAPDSFRDSRSGPAQAEAVTAAIGNLQEQGHKPAALLVDTVLSSEGILQAPEGWAQNAAQAIRNAGGLFIADEVQAGFGRTGKAFWGFERWDVTPDLITLGKPMGNGHPISAVVARREIVESFSQQSHYFNTFAGNPVSCAAALAVLDVMESESLMAHAQAMGEYLLTRLSAISERYPVIGDVRGSGLFIGLDLVEQSGEKSPAPEITHRVVNGLRQEGVLVGQTGRKNNVVKIRPPMVINRDEADFLLQRLEKVLNLLT